MVVLDRNVSAFIYGSELQGRGVATQKDVTIGLVMFTMCLSAVLLGSYNLYLIRKMSIFHNAFGWFWASRTTAEVITNLVHVVYSAPVTIMQPTNISVTTGVSVFIAGYFFAVGACVMHQIVSLNRCIAVYFPFNYDSIFKKSNCIKIIAACWAVVPFIMACYIGKNFVVAWNPKIVDDQIKKIFTQNANFNRDVRFFMQTCVQNFTMIVAGTMVVIANNEYRLEDEVIHILGFHTLIATHINNALALLIFNPEVRSRFRNKVLYWSIDYLSSSAQNQVSVIG